MTAVEEFIVDKMSSYVSGGMAPETAAKFTRGELLAIYKGDHWSRDAAGKPQKTLSPEALGIEAAMRKADAAIAEIISSTAPVEKLRNVYRSSDAIKRAVAAGIGIKEFFITSPDNDPDAYTTDLRKIAAWWKEGKRQFKSFVRGKFLVLDIDRKPGKPDGLKIFYQIFSKETLPAELQDLPQSFPCFVKTPSGGFHLYFKYSGPEFKLPNLGPSVELKEFQITPPGSRKENGEYILHGELSDAPPLFGLILDAIEGAKQKLESKKAERSKPKTKAAADRPAQFTQSRITLDDLANEATSAYGGHHDRQVSFAGRACRCKFSGAETLAYVKANQNIFGNDNDTENTVLSVFRDNGAA
jgi:hypothetical protein